MIKKNYKKLYYVKIEKRTLNIPNILGLLDDSKDIDKSIIEMITRTPSIIFQPEVK